MKLIFQQYQSLPLPQILLVSRMNELMEKSEYLEANEVERREPVGGFTQIPLLPWEMKTIYVGMGGTTAMPFCPLRLP